MKHVAPLLLLAVVSACLASCTNESPTPSDGVAEPALTGVARDEHENEDEDEDEDETASEVASEQGGGEDGSERDAAPLGTATVDTTAGPREVDWVDVDGTAITEGDIELGPTNVLVAGNPTASREWPGGIVPYTIATGLSNQARVTKAITHWESRTGIRFVKRTSETAYVTFTTGRGCSSSVGRTGGRQFIRLASSCATGSVIHEIGHAIGLWHEQSRSDRNDHVRVIFDNILSSKKGNFRTTSFKSVGEYDLGSIMHYGSYAFSRNRKPTITRLDGSTFKAQRAALSTHDVNGVHAIYAAENLPPPRALTTDTATTTQEAKLRSGPAKTHSIVKLMPAGSTVTRLGRSENGYDLVRSAGLEGWAYAAYLED